MNNLSIKPILAVSVVTVMSISAGYAFQQSQTNSETDRQLESMAKHAKADPVQMKEIGKLVEKASNPKDLGAFSETDFQKTISYRNNGNFELRRMSYSTLASLRKTQFREQAITLIQDLKTSKDLRDQDNYLVFAWKLDAPDWRAYAKSNLSNPRMADTAQHLLKVGSPKR